MKPLLLILVLFSSPILFAQSGDQQGRIDSLITRIPELEKAKQHDSIMDAMNFIAYCYRYERNVDSSKWWFEQSLSLAREHQNLYWIAMNLEDIGLLISHLKGNPKEAVGYLEQALAIRMDQDDPEKLALSYNQVGAMYIEMGNIPIALENLQKAMTLFADTEDSLGIADVNTQLATLYSKQEEFERAHDYYLNAYEILNLAGNPGDKINVLNNLGLNLKKMKRYDEALRHYFEGLQIEQEVDNPIAKAILYHNIGNVKELQGDFDSALYYQQQSYHFSNGYQAVEGWSNKGLAAAYVGLNQSKLAIQHAENGYRIADEIGELDLKKQSAETLAKAHAASGNHEKAYRYYQEFKLLSDSMFNEQNVRKVTRLSDEYQFNKEKELQETLFQTRLDQEATIRNLIIAGLILVIILAIVLYLNFRNTSRINRQLKEQKEQLTELNATKNRFFGIIAHDLRSPLTALQGVTRLLSYYIEKQDFDTLKKIGNEIEDSTAKVNTLLDNLLKWALVQEDAMPNQPEELTLKPLIEESLKQYEHMAKAKNIRLGAIVSEEAKVYGDKNSLLTVFRNLISNGIKFTSDGGMVDVSAMVENGTTKIEVKDNGMGIKTDKLERLFQLQERKSTPGTREEKGTGLGLMLVHDFIRMNQGNIQVSSELNKGTVFHITLPSKLIPA